VSFTQGAGFRICGSVVRRFVVQSGKVAFLTLDVFADGHGKKIDLRGFKEMVEEIGTLQPGALIEVTGAVEMEKVTAKDRSPVMVDGREKWVPCLTVRAIKTEGSSRASNGGARAPASSTPPANPEGDQNDPANW
jgi:hypothetical protein